MGFDVSETTGAATLASEAAASTALQSFATKAEAFNPAVFALL